MQNTVSDSSLQSEVVGRDTVDLSLLVHGPHGNEPVLEEAVCVYGGRGSQHMFTLTHTQTFILHRALSHDTSLRPPLAHSRQVTGALCVDDCSL